MQAKACRCTTWNSVLEGGAARYTGLKHYSRTTAIPSMAARSSLGIPSKAMSTV